MFSSYIYLNDEICRTKPADKAIFTVWLCWVSQDFVILFVSIVHPFIFSPIYLSEVVNLFPTECIPTAKISGKFSMSDPNAHISLN